MVSMISPTGPSLRRKETIWTSITYPSAGYRISRRGASTEPGTVSESLNFCGRLPIIRIRAQYLSLFSRGAPMGLFAKRTPANERSVAEIEADLEHYRERHALYLLTIRTLLYYIKEFSLDLTEIEADRFKECMDTLAGHFLGDAGY